MFDNLFHSRMGMQCLLHPMAAPQNGCRNFMQVMPAVFIPGHLLSGFTVLFESHGFLILPRTWRVSWDRIRSIRYPLILQRKECARWPALPCSRPCGNNLLALILMCFYYVEKIRGKYGWNERFWINRLKFKEIWEEQICSLMILPPELYFVHQIPCYRVSSFTPGINRNL